MWCFTEAKHNFMDYGAIYVVIQWGPGKVVAGVCFTKEQAAHMAGISKKTMLTWFQKQGYYHKGGTVIEAAELVSRAKRGKSIKEVMAGKVKNW